MIQKSLFDDERTFRRSDPPTSKAAGREISHKINSIQQLVLGMVRLLPEHTAQELAERVLCNKETFRKRFHELHRKGLIEVAGSRRCRVTGKVARVWR